jgi:hypothetical protein
VVTTSVIWQHFIGVLTGRRCGHEGSLLGLWLAVAWKLCESVQCLFGALVIWQRHHQLQEILCPIETRNFGHGNSDTLTDQKLKCWLRITILKRYLPN